MEKILYLVHRIPYPPNKGDKIRSYHFLKALARRYQVYLGTFVDDPEDWQYQQNLTEYCQDVHCQPLNPRLSKLKSLKGLVTGQALSIPYYQSRPLQQWVDNTLAQQNISKVVIFSSVMAQFVMDKPGVDIIVDFVDVDSDKWRQYAEKKTAIERWIYRRESEKLLTFEKQVTQRSKSSFFVSRQEAELFKQLAPELQHKVSWVNNGVDTDFFDPAADWQSPYKKDEAVLVFTGAMDYWPNIDAVTWFAEQVFPKIQQQHSHVKFYIVGSKPSPEVLALAENNENIIVTGRVDQVQPYLHFAALAVAPLRVARGIQNKVLEAMAMEKTVIATPAAMEGIEGVEALDVVVDEAAEILANQTVRLLTQTEEERISRQNRQFVENNFSWASSADSLLQQLMDR
jgi:sugar transferase (PEP-CTERM/EpsH1 system associated)